MLSIFLSVSSGSSAFPYAFERESGATTTHLSSVSSGTPAKEREASYRASSGLALTEEDPSEVPGGSLTELKTRSTLADVSESSQADSLSFLGKLTVFPVFVFSSFIFFSSSF